MDNCIIYLTFLKSGRSYCINAMLIPLIALVLVVKHTLEKPILDCNEVHKQFLRDAEEKNGLQCILDKRSDIKALIVPMKGISHKGKTK